MSSAMYAAASLYNDPRYFSRSEVRIRANKLRRQRIFRRQVMILASIAALVIFAIVFFGSTLRSDAQSDTFKPEFKYYTAVTVHVGDTLWSIASDNYSTDHYDSVNSYISEICKINNLADSESINAGECIILPYYSNDYK